MRVAAYRSGINTKLTVMANFRSRERFQVGKALGSAQVGGGIRKRRVALHPSRPEPSSNFIAALRRWAATT